MADIFSLFDGTLGAGGGSSVASQNGSSFSSVSEENDLVALLASGSDSIQPLVDYSDFSNFVTFNSAQSYVTVTADQVLNSYPFDGSAADLQIFLNSIDGFQQYFLEGWPSVVGHLRFNPAFSSSYVSFVDAGTQDGASRTAFLSPGTGSLTVQGWVDVPVLTGSNDVQVILQKNLQGSTDGFSAFVSGSSVYFRVSSGSSIVSASGAITHNPMFFAGVLDRTSTTGTLSLYMGTTGTFPVLSDSENIVIGSSFNLASGSFFMGSGSIPGQIVRPFTGSLDDITVWNIARYSGDLTGSYNRKVYSQYGLTAGWRFNDSSQRTPQVYSSIVRDCSGHHLDGRIQNFFPGIIGSGSLSSDSPDPILSLGDPDVISYVVNAQVTGALYDRNNESIIYNLFPGAFSNYDPTSADVFQNFALVLARHFDRIKLYVNQLVNLRRVTSYGGFDQAPDELLDEVGRYFGWDLHGNFVTTDALRYFLGRNVQAGTATNVPLTTQLNEIKAQFWRRMLLNLNYIYKTKGTRESVESLLRVYGADNGFVRLKEYARTAETGLTLERVATQKSVYCMMFSGGATVSITGSV
jgi:hypothetical protein